MRLFALCLLAVAKLIYIFLQYLMPWARVGVPYGPTNDPALGRDLWAWLEEQVKDI